jgi:hypothetical protein
MDGQQIDSILTTDPFAKKIFQGVYARDEINIEVLLQQSKPTSDFSHFVCNLDRRDKPGSHWILIELNHSKKEIFYFDSYGLPPFFTDLLSTLHQTNYPITWNKFQLQSLSTTVCGQYCIIFCLLRSRNYSIQNILNLLFYNNKLSSHDRDHTVYSFIKSIFSDKLITLDSDIHNILPFL